jgi:hypothetical protein
MWFMPLPLMPKTAILILSFAPMACAEGRMILGVSANAKAEGVTAATTAFPAAFLMKDLLELFLLLMKRALGFVHAVPVNQQLKLSNAV